MAQNHPETSKLFRDWITLSNDVLSRNNNNSERDRDPTMEKELLSLSSSLFQLFETPVTIQLMNAVCQQLLALFRSRTRSLCLLVLEFIPLLIWKYLSSVQSSGSKVLNGLEACLLTLYNLNLVQSGNDTQYIIIPSLGKSSVYHEVASISTNPLTEGVLSKYESTDKKLPIGPFPLVEKLNAKNRLPVLSHLVRCYTKEIGLLSASSHQALCALSIKVCCTGFKAYLSHRLLPHASHPTEGNLISRPRIALSSEFLCEILHGIYFVMFNGQPETGLEVLECIHQRANYELYPNVLLLTNAIKNSLEHNPSGQPYDGPMGMSIAITPAHILNNLNRYAITNSSFRTQKLPDDITPEDGDESPSDTEADTKNASAVSERPGKLLGSIKLSTRPLKSALKRVERSITQKKNTEASPAKTDKVDGHVKVNRQGSGSREKSNSHEMTTLPSGAVDAKDSDEYSDAAIGNGFHDNSDLHRVVDHKAIEIIIEAPIEEDFSEVTNL